MDMEVLALGLAPEALKDPGTRTRSLSSHPGPCLPVFVGQPKTSPASLYSRLPDSTLSPYLSVWQLVDQYPPSSA